MNFLIIILLNFIFFTYSESSAKRFASKNRQKRTIFFPQSAVQRIMYIYGIGIPMTDLEYESLTTGYVLKSQYILPYQAAELRQDFIRPLSIGYIPPETLRSVNKRSDEKRSVDEKIAEHTLNGTKYISYPDMDYDNLPGYRWILYKGIELLMNMKGKTHGRPCLLKSICEAAASPFHYAGGLISEIVHIVLTPSLSTDKLSHHSDNQYLHAESIGKTGAPCERVFFECRESFLDKLTHIFDI